VSIRYRADIDGLRAIAVLGVVLYHVGGLGVRGGYVGVDVFFVISGFLITGILAREFETGSFSLANFYVRRIRRILPALAATLVASTIAAVFILFPADFEEYGKSLLSVARLVSNFHFARKTGYFDGGADEKPLLHTWSLAVEEQFYLLFPLLLFALFHCRRGAVLPTLALLTALSLFYSISETERFPERAFYYSGARAWELLLGALCALLPAVPAPRALREVTAAAGVATIAVAYLLFSDTIPFPGYLAIFPCLGAAAVIVGSREQETLTARFLSLPFLVGIGLISYSVYLWHWPLLVFVKYRFSLTSAVDHAQALALILISVALGYLSWRFVEQPFRHAGRRSATVFATAGGLFAIAATTAVLIAQSRGLPSRWPPAIDVVRSGESIPCRRIPQEAGWPPGACKLGSKSAQFDILIWGDSHAGMIADGIAQHLPADHGAIRVTSGGCPPLLDVRLCQETAKTVLAKLAEGRVQHVVLAARWALYAEGERMAAEAGVPVGLAPDQSDNLEIFGRQLRATISSIRPYVRQVVLIGPVPELDFSAGRAIARNIAWRLPLPAPTSGAAFRERQRHVFPVLKALEREPGVRVFYPDRWFCDATCAYRAGGESLYVDNDHITPAGEHKLDEMFAQIFPDLRPPVTSSVDE
jgi:peptidoglycan/LPS O-acetylase OafA/YrhL